MIEGLGSLESLLCGSLPPEERKAEVMGGE